MGRRSIGSVVATLVFGIVAACASFAEEDPPVTPVEGGAPPPQDGPIPTDSATPVDAPADVISPKGCPFPKMHRFVEPRTGWAFCIDDLEVSEGEYSLFRSSATLAADIVAATPKLPVECTFNVANPVSAGSADGPLLPARSVDYCSAALYCVTKGKRMCGAMGTGGAVAPSSDDTDRHEWVFACTNGGVDPAPYPPNVDAGCRVNVPEAGPAPVGSNPLCGRDGLLDQIGNAWEWVNERTDMDGGASYTRVMGGAWDGVAAPIPCRIAHAYDGPPGKYGSAQPNVGIRCCADAPR